MIMVAVMTIIEFHSEWDDISTYILKGIFWCLVGFMMKCCQRFDSFKYFQLHRSHTEFSATPLIYRNGTLTPIIFK